MERCGIKPVDLGHEYQNDRPHIGLFISLMTVVQRESILYTADVFPFPGKYLLPNIYDLNAISMTRKDINCKW